MKSSDIILYFGGDQCTWLQQLKPRIVRPIAISAYCGPVLSSAVNDSVFINGYTFFSSVAALSTGTTGFSGGRF
jgi:hypothetical protein